MDTFKIIEQYDLDKKDNYLIKFIGSDESGYICTIYINKRPINRSKVVHEKEIEDLISKLVSELGLEKNKIKVNE